MYSAPNSHSIIFTLIIPFFSHINRKTQYERPYGFGGSSATIDQPIKYGTLPSSANQNHYSHYNVSSHCFTMGPKLFQSGTLKSSSSPRDSGFDSSPTRYRKFGDPPDTAASSTDYEHHSKMFSRTSNPLFTTDPTRLGGEMISTKIVKGAKGLGFTLIGNDASSRGDEFIQVIICDFRTESRQVDSDSFSTFRGVRMNEKQVPEEPFSLASPLFVRTPRESNRSVF